MKRLFFIAAFLAAAYLGNVLFGNAGIPATGRPGVSTAAVESAVTEAFRQQRSDVQVTGGGRVSRLLSDDNEGSRHQRFILTVGEGHTVLVAHNIDLAPRIANLKIGDTVRFFGEYEWNERGGVIHWTHHDPAGRHVGGWLQHEGRTYQ